jgi:large subunit ribosomal protein L22
MPGPKTNEREGTRAVLHYCQTSAFKIRPVLDLIRNKTVGEARDILRFSDRDAARIVGKLLDSAIANAEANDEMDPEELFVSACFADEGMTHKRWRPRARGRATRIRKRTSHITVIVSRLPEDKLARLRAHRAAEQANRRARRVAGGRATRRSRRDQQVPGTTESVATAAAETVEQTVAEQDASAGVESPGATDVAETEAPETEAPETEAPETEAPETEAPEPTAADVAEAEEAEGIVDQQAEAVAQAEAVEDQAEAPASDGEQED